MTERLYTEAEVSARVAEALRDAADEYQQGGIIPGYPDRHVAAGFMRDLADEYAPRTDHA